MTYTVLIIDGDARQRDTLRHTLQSRLGCHTRDCDSSGDAEGYFQSDSPPDLTLIDWISTRSEKAVADLKQFSDAPIVALVKYGDYDTAVTALNAGAHDFLNKPVPIERMSATFRNLLMLRDACREIKRLRGQEQRNPDVNAALLPPAGFMQVDGNIRRIDEIEAEAIRFAMQFYHGRMTEVARRLGISRSTLYRKLSGLGEVA